MSTSHDKLLRDFFLGMVKLHILHHASEEPTYGMALMMELKHHGYELSPGLLYPMLHQLEKAAYLISEKRTIDGRQRKYYRATPLAREALQEAASKVQELVHEVFPTI